jgi:hypothetical protein
VTGVGEQHLVRGDERLDAAGGGVEALRQPRHLVAALHLDARREIALPELLHTRLQPLESSGQAPHDRIGKDRDDECDRAEREDDAKRRVAVMPARRARDEPAAVGKRDRPRGAAAPVHPPALVPSFRRGRQGAPGGGDRVAVGPEEREVERKAAREFLERVPLHVGRRLGRRKGDRRELSGHLEGLPHRQCLGRAPPERAGEEHHGDEAHDDREIDLLRQPPHRDRLRLSPALSRTRSRRRAR